MNGLCECGCGLPAPISPYADPSRGYVKGQPRRFIHNHHKGNFEDGRTKLLEYKSYRKAKSRCSCTTDPDYSRYGGRGILFLFKDFPEFLADVGMRPSPNHSIDRIKNEGHYEPGNCKWSTPKEQANNRSPTKAEVSCKECSKLFVGRKLQKFCSGNCASRAWYRRHINAHPRPYHWLASSTARALDQGD